MKLNIYFLRHGLSKCNLLHNCKSTKYLTFINILRKDPRLSDIGILQSTKARTYLKKHKLLPHLDYIFCSSLLRSIETSCYMFPTSKVVIAPYISEKSPSLENVSYNFINQKKRLNSSIYDNVEFPSSEEFSQIYNESDLKKFITYIISYYNITSDSNIAVITHSHFLKDILNQTEKVKNNCVYKIDYYSSNDVIDNIKCIFSGYTSQDLQIADL